MNAPTNSIDRYLRIVLGQLEACVASQRPELERAASLIARALADGRFLYAFGTGHSHMLAEEIFYRAGGLARACPILDESLMLHAEAARSTEVERQPGYAREILSRYPLEAGDVLVIASNSGRNAVPIEMALAAGERGVVTIAITSFAHTRAFPSRHVSGQRLRDVAQVALDNQSVAGDAALSIEGLPDAVAPTSTLTGAFLFNALVARAIERLVEAGHRPEVYASSNADHGAAANAELLERYRGRIRHL